MSDMKVQTTMQTAQKARLDTRLLKEQKELFEYAATLGGFSTLTDFVVYALQQQSNTIIEKYKYQNAFLASKKDQEIFFDAITNPQPPNEALRNAAKHYNQELNAK